MSRDPGDPEDRNPADKATGSAPGSSRSSVDGAATGPAAADRVEHAARQAAQRERAGREEPEPSLGARWAGSAFSAGRSWCQLCSVSYSDIGSTVISEPGSSFPHRC